MVEKPARLESGNIATEMSPLNWRVSQCQSWVYQNNWIQEALFILKHKSCWLKRGTAKMALVGRISVILSCYLPLNPKQGHGAAA